MNTLKEFWGAILRQKGLLGLSGAAIVVLLLLNVALFGPLLYKLAVIAAFATLGYYINDWAISHYVRPSKLKQQYDDMLAQKGVYSGDAVSPSSLMAQAALLNAALNSRALIVVGAMVAGAIAV